MLRRRMYVSHFCVQKSTCLLCVTKYMYLTLVCVFLLLLCLYVLLYLSLMSYCMCLYVLHIVCLRECVRMCTRMRACVCARVCICVCLYMCVYHIFICVRVCVCLYLCAYCMSVCVSPLFLVYPLLWLCLVLYRPGRGEPVYSAIHKPLPGEPGAPSPHLCSGALGEPPAPSPAACQSLVPYIGRYSKPP